MNMKDRVNGIVGLIHKGESINSLYLLELPSPYFTHILSLLKESGYKREPHSLLYYKPKRKKK